MGPCLCVQVIKYVSCVNMEREWIRVLSTWQFAMEASTTAMACRVPTGLTRCPREATEHMEECKCNQTAPLSMYPLCRYLNFQPPPQFRVWHTKYSISLRFRLCLRVCVCVASVTTLAPRSFDFNILLQPPHGELVMTRNHL